MKKFKFLKPKGFTLVELLVVIAIIVILFAVILVAVDPARRIGQAQDAVRRQDVRDILESVQEYVIDNDGSFPSELTADGNDYVIGSCATGASCSAVTPEDACADLDGSLVDTYLAEMPTDPDGGTAAETGYYVNLSATGRVTVGACDTYSGTITIKR